MQITWSKSYTGDLLGISAKRTPNSHHFVYGHSYLLTAGRAFYQGNKSGSLGQIDVTYSCLGTSDPWFVVEYIPDSSYFVYTVRTQGSAVQLDSSPGTGYLYSQTTYGAWF